MNMKSKFQKQGKDIYNKSTSKYVSYLDLNKFGLDKFKFEKKEKDYLFSILPYEIESELHPDFGERDASYNLEIWIHYIKGLGGFICMNKMFGKECAVCDKYKLDKEKLENDGVSREDVWEEVKELAYKQRMLYHILYNGKHHVADLPYSYFEETWEKLIERKKAKGIDLWPIYLDEDGCTDIEFTYTPQGEYYKLVNYDFPPIVNYDKKNTEGLISLEKLLIIPDYETLKNALLGLGYAPEEEITEEKVPEKNYYKEVIEKEPEKEVVMNNPVKKKKKVSNECPYNEQFQTQFGKDFNEWNHCDECEIEHTEVYGSCKIEFEKQKNRI